MNLPRADVRKLGALEPRELAVRFAFGAGISAIAAAVSLAFGPRVGGMFLAFPAILPATLTLIQQKESKRDAEHDDEGAVLGAVALIAFGLAVYELLPNHSGWLSLAGASAAWLVAAVALYAVAFGRSPTGR
jgi:uncharacterized membrane protein (GlpM family)